MCCGLHCACANSLSSHRPSFQILPLDGKLENAPAIDKNVEYKQRYLFEINTC